MSIKWKIFALFSLLTILPLAVSAYFNEQYKSLAQERAIERLDAVASNLEKRMALIHQINRERLAGVLSRTQLRITYDRYQRVNTREDRAKLERILSDALGSIPSFQRISVVSLDGLHPISTGGNAPLGIKNSVMAAKHAPNHSVTVLLKVNGEWQLLMVGPLYYEYKHIGYGVVQSSADDILAIAKKDAYFEHSGDVLIATRTSGPDEFLHTNNSPLLVTHHAVQSALDGEARTYTDLRDVHGTPLLVATRFSEQFRLGLILKVDQEEIFGPIHSLLREQLTVFLLLIAPAVFGALFIARSVYSPVFKLKDLTYKISEGDRHVRVQHYANDEMGELGRAFDNMLDEMESIEVKQKQANEDLSHFTQIAAHDLREPARKGVTLSQLLENALQNKDYEDLEQIAGYIGASSRRMLGMIDGFRVLANVGAADTVRHAVDLKLLIEKLIEEHKQEIDSHNVVVQYDEFPESIQAYESLLVLLYKNLINNVFDHAKADPILLRFTCYKDGDRIIFGVRNTGSSIARKDWGTVFKMFRTVKSSSSSGVGLSICRKVIDRHKGDIWVDSDEDSTHIKFTLN